MPQKPSSQAPNCAWCSNWYQPEIRQLRCSEIIEWLAEIPPVPQPPTEGSPPPIPEGPTPPSAVSGRGTALTSGARNRGEAEATHPTQVTNKAKRKPSQGGNPLPKDIRPKLTRILGVDLTLVPGLNLVGVLMILSEIGTDLKRWRDGDAFAAWLGLCPGSNISGGKVLSSRTPHVVNRVAVLLRLAALAIGRTETCLGGFYRRMKAKQGAPKAMTATARKLAVLIHHLLTNREEYQEPELKAYDERVRKAKIIRLSRQAKELGFNLVPLEQAG